MPRGSARQSRDVQKTLTDDTLGIEVIGHLSFYDGDGRSSMGAPVRPESVTSRRMEAEPGARRGKALLSVHIGGSRAGGARVKSKSQYVKLVSAMAMCLLDVSGVRRLWSTACEALGWGACCQFKVLAWERFLVAVGTYWRHKIAFDVPSFALSLIRLSGVRCVSEDECVKKESAYTAVARLVMVSSRAAHHPRLRLGKSS